MSSSSTSAASPSDGERECPRWINWESMALFLCAKETCAHMWREEQMTDQTPPSERLGEQEQCWQAVKLQHVCGTSGLWWCGGTCTTLQLHLPFPVMKFCLTPGRNSSRWRGASPCSPSAAALQWVAAPLLPPLMLNSSKWK